jgi:excisionase family DNA binding protein
MTTSPLLLTPREAAQTLATSERTLWSLTAPRGPIPVVRLGRSVRYSTAALVQWIALSERRSGPSTSEPSTTHLPHTAEHGGTAP